MIWCWCRTPSLAPPPAQGGPETSAPPTRSTTSPSVSCNIVVVVAIVIAKLLDSTSIGEALDLFYRFGFFSLSVRVVPRDDPATWLVREPTAAIFAPGSVNRDVRRNPAPSFDPDFQVFFADDEQELLKSYFGAFEAEGVERPYKLYTGSWHASTKAKYLGLSKDAFDGESSFVMVRINKRRATVAAVGQKALRPEVLEAANEIQVFNHHHLSTKLT